MGPAGKTKVEKTVLLFVGCLTSEQHARVSQGRICSDNFTCCNTEVADQTFYLIQSQHADTGPTGPSADPITPGTWQGSHWSANFEVTGMTRPGKILLASGFQTPDPPFLEADALTSRPTRRCKRRRRQTWRRPTDVQFTASGIPLVQMTRTFKDRVR